MTNTETERLAPKLTTKNVHILIKGTGSIHITPTHCNIKL